jgi:hypothetical protein
MSHRLLESARRHRARVIAGLTLLLAAAATSVAAPQLASAAPAPTATAITVTSALSPSISVPNTPGAGTSYIVKDVPFTVSFTTDFPLSTTHDTTVTLTVTNGPDAGTTASTSVPKDATNGTITGVVLPTVANGVVLSVANPDDPAVTPGTITVDVLKNHLSAPSTSKLTGIGGGGGPGVRCVPTATDPTCGDLLLPETNGVLSNQLLSQGSCVGVCRTPAGSVLQALVEVDPTIYNANNPIEFVAKCDKTLCPGKGVKTYTVMVQLTPTSTPAVSPPCLSKGVVTPPQMFCTDYVQSSRNGAGDVLLYVELPIDAKIIW